MVAALFSPFRLLLGWQIIRPGPRRMVKLPEWILEMENTVPIFWVRQMAHPCFSLRPALPSGCTASAGAICSMFGPETPPPLALGVPASYPLHRINTLRSAPGNVVPTWVMLPTRSLFSVTAPSPVFAENVLAPAGIVIVR